MILLQVISVVFGLFMMYVVRIHFKKKHMKPFECGVWMGIWIGYIFLSIFPGTVNGIAQTLHIARVFDLLVIIALMIITVITFQNWIAYNRIDQKLETVIRQRAIDEKQKVPNH